MLDIIVLRGLMDGSNKLELVVLKYACDEIKAIYGYDPGKSGPFFKIYKKIGLDCEYIPYAEIPYLDVKIEGSSIDEIISVLKDEYKIPIPDIKILEQGGIFWKKYYPERLIVYKCPNNKITSIVAHRKIDGECIKVVIEKNWSMDQLKEWCLLVNGLNEGSFESYRDDELVEALEEYDISLPDEDKLIENALSWINR